MSGVFDPFLQGKCLLYGGVQSLLARERIGYRLPAFAELIPEGVLARHAQFASWPQHPGHVSQSGTVRSQMAEHEVRHDPIEHRGAKRQSRDGSCYHAQIMAAGGRPSLGTKSFAGGVKIPGPAN